MPKRLGTAALNCIIFLDVWSTHQTQRMHNSLSPRIPSPPTIRIPNLSKASTYPLYHQAKRALPFLSLPCPSLKLATMDLFYFLNFSKIHLLLSIPIVSVSHHLWLGLYQPPCIPPSSSSSSSPTTSLLKYTRDQTPCLKCFIGFLRTFWIKGKLLSTNRTILYHHSLPPFHLPTQLPNTLLSMFLNMHTTYTEEPIPHSL